MNTSHFQFDFGNVRGNVYCTSNGFVIKGRVNPEIQGLSVDYWASNSADYHLSVAGTALPFANENIALNPTTNKGNVLTKSGGVFEFHITRPNSYYTCGGTQLIPPHVNISIKSSDNNSQVYNIPLGKGYRGRSLTSLPGRPKRSISR